MLLCNLYLRFCCLFKQTMVCCRCRCEKICVTHSTTKLYRNFQGKMKMMHKAMWCFALRWVARTDGCSIGRSVGARSTAFSKTNHFSSPRKLLYFFSYKNCLHCEMPRQWVSLCVCVCISLATLSFLGHSVDIGRQSEWIITICSLLFTFPVSFSPLFVCHRAKGFQVQTHTHTLSRVNLWIYMESVLQIG